MEKKIRLRSLFIGSLFTLLFVGLMIRLYSIQVLEAADLMNSAMRIWQTGDQLTPTRGEILDRNGNILAKDAAAYTVAVNPSRIAANDEVDEIISILAPILDMDRQKLYDIVTRTNSDGHYVSQAEVRNEGWKIDPDVKDQIVQVFGTEQIMNSRGVYLIEQKKRYYPSNELAAQVLGYVDKDGEPRSGIEYYYHRYMKGEAGSISFKKDGKQYELPNGQIEYTPVENGDHVQLTIDQNIQMYMEQAVKTAYELYEPESMIAIAADPDTMEILGMVNMPTFDPNHYWETPSQKNMNNAAVLSTFEPGSTFKIVTLAAAIEEGIFDPDETYMSGTIEVPGIVIGDHNRSGWGEITYLEGLKRSSNVAFVKLGYEGLGTERLLKYIQDFGFGQPTGIDLPGESKGDVSPRYPAEYATTTFGQGVTVTAIQQVAAISAIANGGKLMQPHLLKAVIDSETGEVLEEVEPQLVRQVVSEATATEVSWLLEQVVSDLEIGSGRKAYIEGYHIAGKTGTAQVVENGEYASDKWVASFIGFAPVEDPQIALLVIAEKPAIENYLEASNVVAPVFKEIMGKSLHYFGVSANAPEGGVVTINSGQEYVPQLVGKTLDSAYAEAASYSVELEVLGSGNQVLEQYPVADTIVGPGQKIYVLTQDKERIPLPDLHGRSKRDVVQLCNVLELACSLSGEGYVISQQAESIEGDLRIDFQFAPIYELEQQTEENSSLEEKVEGNAQEGNQAETEVSSDTG